ncbi:MAG: membrane or secreted protein [Thermoanaerobaculia bacterium]
MGFSTTSIAEASMMILPLILAALTSLAPAAQAPTPLTPATGVIGAWQLVGEDGTVATWIVTGEHFSIARYRTDPSRFISTGGGNWSAADGELRLKYEFHTANPDLVGTIETIPFLVAGDELVAAGAKWTRLDSGAPGALEGAWLMTGRKRDGEVSMRQPGVRRTMKILSGTRFQWIAYNVETRQFFGSGGGTYTTADGKYTENIEFFSRDDSRAGASLKFEYDLPEGVWHHQGKSTAGEPMYEIWERRNNLGI